MNTVYLRKIYSEHCVKKRRIVFKKLWRPQTKEQLSRMAAELRDKMEQLRAEGRKVLYLDESMFTRSTVARTAYCLKDDNLTLDKGHLNEPTLALLLAISYDDGVHTFTTYD